jgi:hypothetical protein
VTLAGRLGPRPTPAQLRRAAPDLEVAAGSVDVSADRLSAARLEDARLERQREAVADALQRARSAVDRLVDAAAEGDRAAAAAASATLARELAAVREAGAIR